MAVPWNGPSGFPSCPGLFSTLQPAWSHLTMSLTPFVWWCHKCLPEPLDPTVPEARTPWMFQLDLCPLSLIHSGEYLTSSPTILDPSYLFCTPSAYAMPPRIWPSGRVCQSELIQMIVRVLFAMKTGPWKGTALALSLKNPQKRHCSKTPKSDLTVNTKAVSPGLFFSTKRLLRAVSGVFLTPLNVVSLT